VGYLARHERVLEALVGRMGGAALKADDALRGLESVLGSSAGNLGMIDLDWSTLGRFLPAAHAPKFSNLARTVARDRDRGHGESAQELRRALGRTRRGCIDQALTEIVRAEVAEILRIVPERIEAGASLLDMGMDSLMAVELATSIEARLDIQLSALALRRRPDHRERRGAHHPALAPRRGAGRSDRRRRRARGAGDRDGRTTWRSQRGKCRQIQRRDRRRRDSAVADRREAHVSGPRKALQGLTAPLKERLIQEALQRRLRKAELERSAPASPPGIFGARSAHTDSIPESWCRFDMHPEYQQLRILSEGADKLGISNPFFRVHEGIAGATTMIGGETFTNFSSYNYLGLAGHPDVSAAAKAAIDRYGTSAIGEPFSLGGAPHPPRT